MRRVGFVLLFLLLPAAFSGAADAFDSLRLKWKDLITGGTNYSLSDPLVRSRIQGITNSAISAWNTMDKTGRNDWLWSDLTSTTVSAEIVTAYSRLQAMALAYATYGSVLRGNATLATDIRTGLHWMYAHRYNENVAEYDNWYHWEIGAPLQIANIAVLTYEGLGIDGLSNSLRALEHFTPSPTNYGRSGTFTGANLADRIRAVAVRGAVVKDTTKLVSAREAMSRLFPYVKTGDGYYVDGSFVQHTAHAYTGGYGYVLLADLALLLPWLEGSPWESTDPARTNVIRWVYDSYEPLVYRGAMMDMTRQRGVSRSGSPDHVIGHSIMQSILTLAESGSPADASRMKSMVKYWAQTDTSRSFLNNAPLPLIGAATTLMQDNSIAPRAELAGHWNFGSMDRVVHLRPGWGVGISMCSSRIYNYECMNGENLKGWFQGDGAVWMYNDDLGQYTGFWPTVDPYRLPGTTVDLKARTEGYATAKKSSKSWVGGATLMGNGAAGIELEPYGSTLRACKSWFMFDDEVICLGAGITCGESASVQTTVENRKISASDTNALIVDGITIPTSLGWSTNRAGTHWCSLAGAGGYVFPGATKVRMERKARTGSWSQINTGGSTTSLTSNYVSLLLEHGTMPTNASYAYALLPNFSATQTAVYAAAPEFAILENSTNVQAVKEISLNIIAANFWRDGTRSVDLLTCDKKASVLLAQMGNELMVACSDPTQLNAGTIRLVIGRPGAWVISADPAVTVSKLTPQIELSINVAGAAGKSFVARLAVENTPPKLSAFGHQTIEEDTGTGPIPFVVGDDDTRAGDLSVRAWSPDTNMLPAASFSLGGTGQDRALSIVPRTNQTGTATVWVRVSDGSLTTSNSFELTVTPVNDAPIFLPLPEFTINPGEVLNCAAAATDPEAPPQTLSWALISGPEGAAIASSAGAFSWRPQVAQAGSSNYVRVTVADDGYPTLSATQGFSIHVRPLIQPVTTLVRSAGETLALQIAGQSGPDYYVEESTNLTNWRMLIQTNGASVSVSLPKLEPGRTGAFYRIRLGP